MIYKTRIVPIRATHGLRMLMRTYRNTDISISRSPEWNILGHAVDELDRLYRLEKVAEHAWCTKDVEHLTPVV